MTLQGNALLGRRAVVTGAGKGIGRATALLLAGEGARVLVTSRTEQELATLVEQMPGTGHLYLAGELRDAAFPVRLFQRIRQEWGGLDLLVNNAGMYASLPVEELDPQVLTEVLQVNVVAVFQCMQLAIREMQRQGEGKIINVGSVRSHWTEGGDAGAYNASKFALRGLTESVARQLHGSGSQICVGMVCPGIVDTGLTNPDGQPRPDWLRPETVARAIVHALSAPAGVNIFDTVLFPTSQKPW